MAVPVLGVAHANVNCASLPRALAFHRDVLGLTPLVHTAAAPQDGSAFGLDGAVSWDAWMMTDAGGMASTAIDLLEWRTPAPLGHPYREPQHTGFSRLRLAVTDPDGVRARVCAGEHGASPVPGGSGERFCCHDPGGTLLELVAGPATRLLAVTVGCADLTRSLAWYRRVLDLEVHPASPPDAAALGLPPDARAETRLLRPAGQPDAFGLELTGWHRPPASGRPYPRANHVGIYRVAFLVADAHAAHAELGRLGVTCPPPAFLDLGPEVPVEGVWAVFFPDPDGACLELIEVPPVTAGSETR